MNNNAYQISRALYHNSCTGNNIESLSQFIKADFMNMPFEDNSFDAVYQIDATCHAPDQVGCYKVGGTHTAGFGGRCGPRLAVAIVAPPQRLIYAGNLALLCAAAVQV